MKKTMLFSSALVALAMLASCQKEEFIETPATATGVTEFTATIESTKTTIASDGKVNWEQDDEITVTDDENNSAVYVAAYSGSSTTFTLKPGQTAVGAGPYKATYGDINNQKYSANGANCPLTAQSSTTNFTFSSPYAVVKLTAKSSGGELVKTVVVTYGDNGSFLDCGNGVTLTSDGVVFYVAVHESAVAAKLSVAFYRADGKVATKTRTDPISLAAKILLPVKFESLTWSEDTPTFKAVYNTADAANTLTFYYDTEHLVGEGVLYDNLPHGATANTSWGYDGVRTEIKSVKIDPSVAGYKGLTSTAYMFYNMEIANSISGAQYLDVSNVTDMSYMFASFGNNKDNTTFNVVPDVRGWDTGNVTDMGYMFSGYGQKSTSLTAPPDVSEWDTGNVTNMANMFNSYGKESTSLTAPPEVSQWNTGNVTDMGYMFSGYGKESTSLTDVPDVTGWKTDKVEKMGNLFANYGNTIDCKLDLTEWNLASLTSGNVFNNFSPNTFKVTIPAKTGENANLPEKWYGSGTFFFAPPKNHYFMFTGVFTVSDPDGTPNSGDEKKVYFSKGNLWYGKDGGATDATWNFETNQYDISSSWNANHVSNFYWSKTESVAYAESYNESGTSASDVLFTNATETTAKTDFEVNGQKNVWRTLSHGEWKYLFENHLYNYVPVNGKSGIVIAPDGFSGTIADSYDATAWATAESNGFVFLPNTGFRNNGTDIELTPAGEP